MENIKNIIYSILSPATRSFQKLDNLHKSESCYIFGDGISIKWFDLSVFNNKLSLCCNFIPFHNSFKELNTRYVCIGEPMWFYPIHNTKRDGIKINNLQYMYRGIIKDTNDVTLLTNVTNYPTLFYYKNVLYFGKSFCTTVRDINLTDKTLTNYTSSTTLLVLLSIFLGFTNIFLVGFDYTHLPSRALHWYEKGEGYLNQYKTSIRNKDFFLAASEFVDITTITLDGGSAVLNSISYEQYTGKKPLYKENTEIIEEKYLKVFSKDSMYNV